MLLKIVIYLWPGFSPAPKVGALGETGIACMDAGT